MKDLFLVFVALVIPLFFLFIYVMSTYSRLKTGRSRCADAESEWRAAQDEEHRKAARKKWEAAATDYEKVCGAFPGRQLAGVIGFVRPKPPPAESPERPISASEGKPVR
jgi:hypothetical protein